MVGATSNSRFSVGEQDSSELEECLLNPETRDISQITVTNIEKTEELLYIFMGTDTQLRKDYILKHSEETKG